MKDIENKYVVKFDKRFDIFFKKLYYLLVIVINYGGIELNLDLVKGEFHFSQKK